MRHRGALLLAALIGIGGPPALAQGGATPAGPSYAEGSRPYCDARWEQMRDTSPPTTEAYGHFLDRCLARCPATRKSEQQSYYEGRLRRRCDAHWQQMLYNKSEGNQTYDEYIEKCARTCAAAVPIPALAALGAAAVAGIAVGATSGGGGERPASP